MNKDGSISFVDRNAFGAASHQMPEGHFRNVPFIGTVAVSVSVFERGVRLMAVGGMLCEYLCLPGLGFTC